MGETTLACTTRSVNWILGAAGRSIDTRQTEATGGPRRGQAGEISGPWGQQQTRLWRGRYRSNKRSRSFRLT
ncbi:hypothetical protein RRG08_024311 [Elysia crispata]|uniref:Uncharacterized protein n=1 Tax=Elysia crispata TaxID=231223 RepID=A0AAE1A4S0_9GAST|nr:hypothetical protein RRG08_024311 [Elysia crispata]